MTRPASRLSLRGIATLLAAAFVGLACAPGDAAPEAAALTACPDPRPQMCTKEYRPACGHRCDAPPCGPAERRTYGNACTACADSGVRAITPGTCEGGLRQEPPKLR